jgi:hypothetical protein
MVNGILLLFYVLLFSLSSRFLMSSISETVGFYQSQVDWGFSRRAYRLGRRYKIFAWALLTLVLFVSMAQSFWLTFVQNF